MPMHQDLTGRTFGKLKVLKRLDEKQDRYYVWLCQCECGNTTKVNTRRLTRGTVTDCGCTEKKTARNGSMRNRIGSMSGWVSVSAEIPLR